MKESTLSVAIVCSAIVLLGCIGPKEVVENPNETELVLSDYPELFKKDVIVVIGSNASGIEIEGADAIVENLFHLTGNMPVIKTDAEITEDELAGHNLILVGGADSNEVLKDVYDMMNATEVTGEYPGAGKGVLEMLKNPWDSDKAMLLVAGSDEGGAKAGSKELERSREFDKANVVVDWKQPAKDKQVVNLGLTSGEFKTFSDATRNYFDEKYLMSGTDYSISYDLKDDKWLEETVPDAQLIQAYARFMQPHVTEAFIFLTGETYAMPADFNEFVSDAHLQIINEEDALGIAGVHVKAWEPSGSEGIPAAIILQNANDIPHQINPIPQDVARQVESPVIRRQDDGFVVNLYSWCKPGGLVREWRISIIPQCIVTAENKIIGEYVGDCFVRRVAKDRVSKSHGEYLISREIQPLSVHTRDVIIDGQTRFVIHWRDEDFTAASDSDANTVVNWVESAARTSWTTEIDNWDFDEPPDHTIDIYIWKSLANCLYTK